MVIAAPQYCPKCKVKLASHVVANGKKLAAHLHLMFAGICVRHRHECASCGYTFTVPGGCDYTPAKKPAYGWSAARLSDYE